MSEYLQTKFRGERVTIHGTQSKMFFFFLNLHDLDSSNIVTPSRPKQGKIIKEFALHSTTMPST